MLYLSRRPPQDFLQLILLSKLRQFRLAGEEVLGVAGEVVQTIQGLVGERLAPKGVFRRLLRKAARVLYQSQRGLQLDYPFA